MKKMFVRALLGGVCLFGPVIQASPQEEIIVTGTRAPIEAGRLPAAVTVINRQEIEEMQVNSLPELLTGIAGVDVTVSGGYGKTTGIRMRGTESHHVLVLVDGVRIGSATLGTAAFQHLQPAMIERIEIVRGPRSSLWGSEALGGVIHLFTRRSSGEKPQFSLDARGGSYDTFEVTGGVSGEYRDFDYSAAVTWFDSRGIDARQPTPGFFGVDQPDKDGYDNISVQFSGGYDFSDSGRIDAFIMRAEGTTEYDGNFQDETEFLQQVVGGSLSFNPVESWHTSLRLSEARDETDNYNPSGDFASRFDTRRRQLSWQNDISLYDNHLLTLGVDFREDKVDSSTGYALTSRDNTGVFGQYGVNFHGHQLIASVRRDDDEVFGGKTTGGVGWSYAWQDSLRLYASYGTAYRTPTFNELFFPFFGNPHLKPETAESYEAGLEGQHEGFGWSIRAYRIDAEDLIATVCDRFFNCAPENVNEAQVTGVEGEIFVRWGDWNAALSAEYLDPENETSGKRLPRRARERLSFDLGRDIGRFTLGARLLAEGKRYDNVSNTIKVDGFATVDIRGEYRLNDRLTLRAKVANLLDEEYQTINTYNSFDRNFFLSLHYRSR